MSLDVVEVGRGLEGIIVPVQLLHPSVRMHQCQVNFDDGREMAPVYRGIAITNGSEIALEMPDVDDIETNLGCLGKTKLAFRAWTTYGGNEESNICFGKLVPDQIVLAFEYLLSFIERFEDLRNRFLMRLLGGSDPCAIYTIYKAAYDWLHYVLML